MFVYCSWARKCPTWARLSSSQSFGELCGRLRAMNSTFGRCLCNRSDLPSWLMRVSHRCSRCELFAGSNNNNNNSELPSRAQLWRPSNRLAGRKPTSCRLIDSQRLIKSYKPSTTSGQEVEFTSRVSLVAQSGS